MAGKPKQVEKVQDEEHVLDRRLGIKLRVEVWADKAGRVTRFNLADIDPTDFARDNGRVLGYDNAHRKTHRHFRGEVTYPGDLSYEAAADAFFAEVRRVRKETE